MLLENANVVLLVEDHKLLDNSFLYILNTLIGSSDLYLIFTKEELEPIKAQMKENMKDSHHRDIYSYIHSLCMKRLKIILCIDDSNSKKLDWIRRNPGFISNSMFIQISDWKKET